MPRRKIGLFGGTFDPVHNGHTIVAGQSLDYIGADKIVFIPAKRSPLKVFAPIAGDEDRVEMLELATADNKFFEVSDFEITRPDPGYTLDTVRYFKDYYGSETEIYWLAGADSVEDFLRWYRIGDLIDECNVAVMYRGGFEIPDFSKYCGLLGLERIEKLQKNVIATQLVDISSTEIRQRLGSGMVVEDMLTPAVADYIRRNCLYGVNNLR